MRRPLLRLLLRLFAMAGAVVIGHILGGLAGAIIGACIGTVLISQTEDVVRIACRSAQAGGTAAQICGRAILLFFGHSIVRRLLRAAGVALLVATVTVFRE